MVCKLVYFPKSNYSVHMTHLVYFLFIKLQQICTMKNAGERQNNSGQCKERFMQLCFQPANSLYPLFFFFPSPEKFRAQISIAVNPPGDPLITNSIKHYMKRVKQLLVSEANHFERNVVSISYVRLTSGASDLILQCNSISRHGRSHP